MIATIPAHSAPASGRVASRYAVRALLAAAFLASAGSALPTMALAQADGGRVGAESGPQPANIDRNGVLILVRSTILALDHANRTGNYTVLRDLGAPGFQANTAARLAEIFASHRAQQLDLGGVAVLEPQLTILPRIEQNGMLRMAGFFPSVPAQVNFDLIFAPVNRQWRLYGISLDLTTGSPEAPESAPEPEAEQSTEMPDPPTPTVNPLRLEQDAGE